MSKDSEVEFQPYSMDTLPNQVSWVNSLNAQQAIEQCQTLQIEPARTLEENRVLLKKFIINRFTQSADNVEVDKQTDNDEALNESMNRQVGNPTQQAIAQCGLKLSLVDNTGNSAKLPLNSTNEKNNHIEANCVEKHPTDTQVPEVQVPNLEKLILETASAVGLKIAEALEASKASTRPSDTYTHTPKIFDTLISALPSCSGSNSDKLLHFLIEFKHVFELDLVSDKQLILATLPKTRDQLRTLWSEALTANVSVTDLFNTILQFFLPDRAKRQVISDKIYRVQRADETLTKFITELQNLTDILMPDATQAELLDIVLTGINPNTRARLSGFPAPQSVMDLVQLAPRLEVIRGTETKFNQTLLQKPEHSQSTRFVPSNNHTNQSPRPNFRPRNFNHFNQRQPNFRPREPQYIPRVPFQPNPREVRPSRPNFSNQNSNFFSNQNKAYPRPNTQQYQPQQNNRGNKNLN